MAKKKDNEAATSTKQFEIMSGTIKDGFCNYSYEIKSGVGAGAVHKVDGPGLIKDELQDAFNKFKAHLAYIDDVFEHKSIEVSNIDQFHNTEIAQLFDVTGFAVKGDEGSESVILSGTKYCNSVRGRIEIKSPKILLNDFSDYKFAKQLAAAVLEARNQVEEYNNGNYVIPELVTEEEKTPEIQFQTQQ